MKRVEKDGKTFRWRRGKLVEIPEEWVGKTVNRKTIRQRPSKAIHKMRKDIKYDGYNARRKKFKESDHEDS